MSTEIGDSYYNDGFYGIKPDGTLSRCAAADANYPSQVGQRLTYYTSDNSHLKLEIDTQAGVLWHTKEWTLYFPDGQRVVGINEQTWKRYVRCQWQWRLLQMTFAWTTRLPRTMCCARNCRRKSPTILAVKIVVAYDVPASQDLMLRTDTITAEGPSGTLTWTVNWKTLTIGGDGRRYICNDECVECACRMNFTHWVVDSVRLPTESVTSGNWDTYRFEYSNDSDDGYGEVDRIQTPGGADYTYDYRLEGCSDVTDGCHRTEEILDSNGVTARNLSGTGVTSLQWTYTYDLTNFDTTVRNPDGGTTTYSYHDPRWVHDWKRGLVYLIEEPLGQIRKRAWAQNKVPGLAGTSNKDPNNPYVERESLTLGDKMGQTVAIGKTAVTDYSYDKNGNLLGRTEYDWVNYDSDPEDVEEGITPLRIVGRAYYGVVPSATVTEIAGSDNPTAYYRAHNSALWSNTTGARRLDAARWNVVKNGAGTIIAASDFGYDNAYTSGNLTLEERWDSVKSASPADTGLSVFLECSGADAYLRFEGEFDRYLRAGNPHAFHLRRL